jgi:hypothetical protein
LENIPEPPDADEPLEDRRGFPPAWLNIRSAGNWLSDTAHFWRELVVLNFRKTAFRVRRGEVRCPCQDLSDSGKAWQTSCEPAAVWHNPARFRRVCPLFKQTPEGMWRCSVDTANVRPFWGRAFAWLGGGLVLVYLAAALALFGFLRTGVGYPVRYLSVAWPPAWHEIREARSRFFFDKGRAALAANRPIEAIMSLSQSYELDPGNYAAGRYLAQLWQASGADVSNRIYAQLMRDHPAQRPETAQAWYLALLDRGEFPAIETLALDRLQAEPDKSSGWLNALIFASRRTGDREVLDKVVAATALPLYVRQACRWESGLRGASPALVRQALEQRSAGDPAPYLAYYRVDRLIRAGLADDALRLLGQSRDRLGLHDQVGLGFDAYATLGWTGILSEQTDRLIAAGVSAPLVDVLCAHLTRHPNPVIFEKLFAAVDRHPLAAGNDQLGAYTSLFCTAGACGEWDRMAATAGAIRKLTGGKFTTLGTIETWFKEKAAVAPIERILPALPFLPLEETYALFEFSDQRRSAQKAASAAPKPVITAP